MRFYALSGRQGEALAQYERLEEALSGWLGTDPRPTTRALREDIAAGRFRLTSQQLPRRRNHRTLASTTCPRPGQPSSGAGERWSRSRMLAMTNLLTLTGAGGWGKTRLALEVARDLVGAYPDGVWLVELAPLSEGALVPQVVAGTLGVQEQPGHPSPIPSSTPCATKRRYSSGQLRALDRALQRALWMPSLTIVRVCGCSLPAGSHWGVGRGHWLVPSLSVPDAQHSPTIEELDGYESARLFADRASIRHPGFALTPENARAVARSVQAGGHTARHRACGSNGGHSPPSRSPRGSRTP